MYHGRITAQCDLKTPSALINWFLIYILTDYIVSFDFECLAVCCAECENTLNGIARENKAATLLVTARCAGSLLMLIFFFIVLF